jgi:hypothetical protein
MKWKKTSNFIIAIILTIALTFTTLLNIIGPLHMNASGSINSLSMLSVYSLIYYFCSLVLIWALYLYLRHLPEALFFTLIVVGIGLIIGENYLWGATIG